MIEREKVIHELKDSQQLTMAAIGRDYGMSYVNFLQKCISDALALLKEQEAERNPVIVCPHCGKRVK